MDTYRTALVSRNLKKQKSKGEKHMKKSMIMALVAAFVLSIAGSAFAAPITFDGMVSIQYRENTYSNAPDFNNTITKFVLNGKAPAFGDNVDLYFRLGAEKVSEAGSGRDFVQFPGSDTKSAFALDQFGFVYKNAGWNYKIGRQDTTLGATALLYNNDFFVGKHIFNDGITITGKSGVTDLKVVAVQEERYADSSDNKLYALAASYKPADKWTLGATVARYDMVAGAASNHYAVNVGYDCGKASFFGEYAKSDADVSNKAYDFGMSYSFDKKNAAYAIYHRTEANGDIGGMTDFDNGEKGMYYGFNHKFDKTTTLKFFYKDNTSIANSNDNTSFRTTLVYSF